MQYYFPNYTGKSNKRFDPKIERNLIPQYTHEQINKINVGDQIRQAKLERIDEDQLNFVMIVQATQRCAKAADMRSIRNAEKYGRYCGALLLGGKEPGI